MKARTVVMVGRGGGGRNACNVTPRSYERERAGELGEDDKWMRWKNSNVARIAGTTTKQNKKPATTTTSPLDKDFGWIFQGSGTFSSKDNSTDKFCRVPTIVI